MHSFNAVVFLFTVSSFIGVVYTQDEDQQESKLVCLNEDPYVLNVPKLLNVSLSGEVKVVHSNIDKITQIKQSCNGIEAADLEEIFQKNMENYKNNIVEEVKENRGNVSSEMDSIKKEISVLRENMDNLKEKIEDGHENYKNTMVEEFKRTFEMINATILKENCGIKNEISVLRDVQIEDKKNMENLKEKIEDVHDILKEIKDTVKEIRKNVSSERTDIKKEVSGLNVLGDVHQRIMEKYKETIVKEFEEPIKDFRRRVSSELANITSMSMPILESCKDLYTRGQRVTGVYKIQPKSMNNPFDVLCEMKTRGSGGWTVIQNRFDGSQDFDLSWQEYKDGFGNISREFWLGLEKIYQMTRNEKNELLVEVVDRHGKQYYARYREFGIGPESGRYTLTTLQGFEGDISNGLSGHVGKKFSTKDSDRSHSDTQYRGGWWLRYSSNSNLNGRYVQVGSNYIGEIIWHSPSAYYDVAKTKMLIRAV